MQSRSSRYKLRIKGDIDLTAIRGIRGVKIADHARPTQLAWAPLQLALGSSETGNTAIGGPFTGLSQVIAVADTGLDHGSRDETLHDDFQNRVRALHSWPIDASWDDYLDTPRHDDGAADQNSGHGTHVAGLALGSGARSHGKYSGVAPKAELVFQAIEQYTPVRTDRREEIAPGYYLNGRPMDLVELFEQARGDGARIHVNAWGDPAAGQYTDDSYEADRFLWKYQDAVILFAAGNNGSDNNGDRQLDASSLYAPASGKNVIAVGATEGPLAGVGYRGTWAGFDPDRHRFTNYATRSDPISGQPERMAMISSTGPTHDGRIKPDLCAPGTNLPAPRSRATAAQGWGLTSPMPHYMYLGGTSMATGVAGGFAALVRQAWQQRLGEAPSGPALKALLLFGCQAIARRDGNGIESRFSAGFGRLHLPGSLPRPGLTLVDAVNAGLDSGGKRQFHFTQEREDSLRVLLAWYDYPGERLINDLDLCLIQADGRRIWGNHNAGGDGDPDRINTVELIDLERLAPGRHTLEVIGANVPAGPQGFALVLNRTLEEQTATSPADERATPAARLLRLPVEWLKGIGATYEKRLHEAGIETLVQLVTRDDRELAALMQAPAYRIEKIRQRLTRLAAISEALPPALPDISLKQLLRSRPASLTPQEWQPLQQLEEIFDKDILGRIRLMPLEG
ncbi:MAG: S8 family serine peptidase [Candidatus Thiodiazotropha sp.]